MTTLSRKYFRRKLNKEYLPRDSVKIGANEHAITAGQHEIDRHALHHHVHHGSYTMLSASNPLGPDGKTTQLSTEENSQRNAKLVNELKQHGAIFHEAQGVYGGKPETSYMVHHKGNVTPELLENVAKKHGQESVFHSMRGQHQLKFVNGTNAGKHHKGKGVTTSDNIADNYSQLGSAGKFQGKLDFRRILKSAADYYTIMTKDGHHIAIKPHVDKSVFHE